MARYRHLSKAPVVEAVFDVRVQLAAGANVDKIKQLHGRIVDGYPDVDEMRRWQGVLGIQGGAQMAQTQDLGAFGFRFKSKDMKRIVQYRLDGFTFSRMAPYTNWPECFAEARRLWDVYAAVGVESVTRVATRYINVMDFPMPIPDLDAYMMGLPPMPELNLNIESFLNRVQVSDQQGNFRAIITHAIQPPRNPGVATILLDIDVFVERAFRSSFDVAWKTLNGFQKTKNELFFGYITDKAAELFE